MAELKLRERWIISCVIHISYCVSVVLVVLIWLYEYFPMFLSEHIADRCIVLIILEDWRVCLLMWSISPLSLPYRCQRCIKLIAAVMSKLCWLVAWHGGRTSVFGRRIFPVLRSNCSWRVTTYVGKPSAIGQPTRPTQPFIPSWSLDE